MRVEYYPYQLKFRFDAGTSRGVLKEKETYFLKVSDDSGRVGWGECSPIWGLSVDSKDDFEDGLRQVVQDLELKETVLDKEVSEIAARYDRFPAIRTGVEMALFNLLRGGDTYFPSEFPNQPIPINGLVWMGDLSTMRQRAEDKINAGFTVIKLKIGALKFDEELALLTDLRKQHPSIVLRVDANGGFSPGEIGEVLSQLKQLDIHSIEQPIAAGQQEEMATICRESSVPVALDEELIGCTQREELLDHVRPQYLILKPSLLGGFSVCDRWIKLAQQRNMGWWTTSALESNLGLAAIAQYTSAHKTDMVHGLGTGALYHNNLASPLEVREGYLWYSKQKSWDFSNIC